MSITWLWGQDPLTKIFWESTTRFARTLTLWLISPVTDSGFMVTTASYLFAIKILYHITHHFVKLD